MCALSAWELLSHAKTSTRDRKFEEADQYFEKAIEVAEAGDPTGELSVRIWRRWSDSLSRRGDGALEHAIDLAGRAVHESATRLGTEDVRTGEALFTLGARLREKRRDEEAFQVWSRAAAIFARPAAPASGDELPTLRRLWEVATDLERLEDALDIARRFYAEVAPDSDEGPYFRHANHMVATSLLRLGRAAESLPYFEHVLADCQRWDRLKSRTDSPATREAAEWLERARIAADADEAND